MESGYRGKEGDGARKEDGDREGEGEGETQMEREMKILKKESSTPASSHWTLSSKRVNNRWWLDKEEMMREGIQTEFKYVQFTTKTGDEKSALLAPKGIGSR
jgi:hypothetical protein